MKYKISATTFNGTHIEPEIELFVEFGEANTLLPAGIYSEVKRRVLERLGRESMDEFAVISKDLESLQANNIAIDRESLMDKLVEMVSAKSPKDKVSRIVQNYELQRVSDLYNQREYESARRLYSEIDTESLRNTEEKDEYMLLGFR